MRGDVHVYHVVRQKVANVRGVSPRHLIKKALAHTDETIRQLCSQAGELDYAEAEESFLVDILDKRGQIKDSLSFESMQNPAWPGLCKLIKWYDKQKQPPAELRPIIADLRRIAEQAA